MPLCPSALHLNVHWGLITFFVVSIKFVLRAPLRADTLVSFCFSWQTLGSPFCSPTTEEIPKRDIRWSNASLSASLSTLHGVLTFTQVVDKSLPLTLENVFTLTALCSATCKISTINLHVSSNNCKLHDGKHAWFSLPLERTLWSSIEMREIPSNIIKVRDWWGWCNITSDCWVQTIFAIPWTHLTLNWLVSVFLPSELRMTCLILE